MKKIIEIIESLLGKTLEPQLIAQIKKVEMEQQMNQALMQQQALRQKSSIIFPRQAGKTAVAQMAGLAGCTPPGTVQQMQQQSPHLYPHRDIMEEYERFIAGMIDPKNHEPEEITMEFSLEE